MANILITIGANVGTAIAKIEALGKSIKASFGTIGASLSSGSPLGKTVNGFTNTITKSTAALTNFNAVARVGTSAARAIGTSMIFAGGAFRDLGVAINVAASLFQSFIPIIQAVVSIGTGLVSALGELGPAVLPLQAVAVVLLGYLAQFIAQTGVAIAQLGVLTIALYSIAQSGFEFNAVMETTQISIATLVTQFKNLYDVTGQQIGGMKELTDAQIKSMTQTERENYGKQAAVAVNEKLSASLGLARAAFLTLTVEAAQSPFTTLELAKGFQAVTASLGQFNIGLDDAAKLTVTLGRVASVAGVAGGQLASQFTLFLTGAGRITSPLARFAAQIGLTKDKIKELRAELEAAKDSPEKTAAIIAILTTRLSAFDQAGNRVALSWAGIMSNMTEAFQLFAGSVTGGLFTTLRNAILGLVPVTDEAGNQMFKIYDKNFNLIGEKAAGTYKLLEGETEVAVTRVTGLLSKIFNYNDTGNLPIGIQNLANTFQEAFRPAIQTISELFSAIGTDIAGLLEAIVGKVQEIAVWLGNNKALVFEIYGNAKILLGVIFDIIAAVATWFGVSGDVNNTAIEINNSLVTVARTLEGIRVTFDLIKGLIYTIAAIGGNIGLVIAPIVDLIDDAYRKLRAIATLDFSQANEFLSFKYTRQVLNDIGEADAKSKLAFADMADSGNRLLGYDQKRADLNRQIAANLEQQRKDIDAYRAKHPAGSVSGIKFPELPDDEVLRRIAEDKITQNERKVGRTTPRRVPGVDDAAAGGAKRKIREVAELASSAFKEFNAVLSAALQGDEAQVKQTFEAISNNLALAGQTLQEQFDKGAISFIELNRQSSSIAIAGIQNEINELNKLDAIRKQQHDIDVSNVESEAAQETIRYRNRLEALQKNKKSQTEIDNLTTAHEVTMRKFGYELAKLDAKNTEEAIKHQTDVQAKAAEVQREVQKSSNQLFLSLKKAGDDAVSSLAEIESLRGGSTAARELQLEVESRDQLNALLQNQASINKILEASKNDALSTDQDVVTINTIYVGLLDRQQKAIADMIVLKKAQLRVDEAQKEIAAKRFDFDFRADRIGENRNLGLISDQQAVQQTADAMVRYQDATRNEVQALADLAAFLRANGGLEGLLAAEDIEKSIRAWEDLSKVQNQAAVAIRGTLREGFTTFFEDIQSNITGIGDAFAKLGQSILSTFQKLIAERLSEQLFDSLFGSTGVDKGQPGYHKGLFGGNILETITRKLGIGATRPAAPTVTEDAGNVAATTQADILNAVKKGTFGKTGIEPVQAAIMTSTTEAMKAAGLALEAASTEVPQITSLLGQIAQTIEQGQAQIKAIEERIAASKITQVPDKGISTGTDGITANGQPVSLDSIGTGSVFMPLLDSDGGEITLVPVEKIPAAKAAAKAKAAALVPELGVGGGIGPGGTGLFNPDAKSGLGEKAGGIGDAATGVVAQTLQSINASTLAISQTLTAISTGALGAGFTAAIERIPIMAAAIDLPLSVLTARIELAITTASSNITGAILASSATSGATATGTGLSSQISAALSATRVASGGMIRGPGGPRDDRVAAWLSNGEFVVQAAAVKKLGIAKLMAINNAHKSSEMPKFGTGGPLDINMGTLHDLLHGGANVAGKAPTFLGTYGGQLAGAAISIGFALLSRLLRKKSPKSDPNRTKDPYGLNPDTLTFYKHPIISGSRNYLAGGGLVTSSGQLLSGLNFAQGGGVNLDSVGSLISEIQGGDAGSTNIKQDININTPDVHSFRNSRNQIERDLYRMTARGQRRRPPKY
jgi:hypothetical protein